MGLFPLTPPVPERTFKVMLWNDWTMPYMTSTGIHLYTHSLMCVPMLTYPHPYTAYTCTLIHTHLYTVHTCTLTHLHLCTMYIPTFIHTSIQCTLTSFY